MSRKVTDDTQAAINNVAEYHIEAAAGEDNSTARSGAEMIAIAGLMFDLPKIDPAAARMSQAELRELAREELQARVAEVIAGPQPDASADA